MASSSSSSQSWIYHVFLSFRGEDTRKTYVDHLYDALVLKGIHTYKDDKELPRGETIGPALLKAIEDSRIAVIIFSENYANSSWCLDEVTYIMKCRRERGQIVMPIFYHVDPSDVRKQKEGTYKEEFAKHELENNHKVESWRTALTEAGNLAGWEPKYIANGLKEIDPSIGYHERLVYLNLDGCEKLETFPPVVRMPKLETLILSRCSRLVKFPEIKRTMNDLRHLYMDNSGIEVLPATVGRYCTNLVFVNLIGCDNLKKIEGNFQRFKQRCVILVNANDMRN